MAMVLLKQWKEIMVDQNNDTMTFWSNQGKEMIIIMFLWYDNRYNVDVDRKWHQ